MGIDLNSDSGKVQLGHRYRDTFTGFEGVATGTALYFGGRWEVLLTRRDQHGKPEDIWFAALRLEEVAAAPPGPSDRPGFV